MSDQADALRQLVRRTRLPGRGAPEPSGRPGVEPTPAPTTARTLVFAGGKGGVGTSNLVLSLGVTLAGQGRRVVVVDADLGRANLDLLAGLSPRADLGDVLAGGRSLGDVVVEGPNGLRVVPGAHALRTAPTHLADAAERLAAELTELSADADLVLVDAGPGRCEALAILAEAADAVVVVTTPEPTAMADAHATFARFRPSPPRLLAVVNQASSASEAREGLARLAASCREFLGLVVEPLGHVRADPAVRRAVQKRRPFVLAAPRGAAARDVARLARLLDPSAIPVVARPWHAAWMRRAAG